MLGQIKIASSKHRYLLVVGLALLANLLFFSKTVSAIDESPATESVQPALPNYRFVAEPCDSLTKLVRRAILTFDEGNGTIALTKARIVYIETNIVQDMGSYLLDIGDNVIVRGQVILNYATKARHLSRAQVLAWQYYVPTVDFELTNIQQPINLKVAQKVLDDYLDPKTPDKEITDKKDDSSAIWWYAGIGSVAVVWYLLWKREDS